MKKLLSILTLLTVGLGQSSDSLISVYTYPDFPIISNPQILPYGSDKVIVTGTNSNDEASNILFFIIDHDGNMINSTEYPDINYLIDFVTVPDGSYIIATNNELWKLIIIDNNFNFSILTNEFNGNELTSISLDEDNRLNVTTTEDSFSEVLQYNLNGELISYFNVYDPDQDTFINENFNHHIRTSNGGFLFANDSSVYKTDFQGHIEWINNDLGVSHIIDILENNGEFLVIGDQGLYYDFYQYSVAIWVDELGNEISSYIADYDNALNSCILIEDGFIFNGNYSYSFQILPIFIRFNQNLEEVLYYPFSGIDGYSTDIHRTNENEFFSVGIGYPPPNYDNTLSIWHYYFEPLPQQSNCTADDGTEGVELWGVCYSIENTQILNLHNSGLTGFIPPEIGNLINLTYLDLSVNQLSGSIPSELWNLVNLTYLNLGVNQLTGTIPPEISNMIGLTELYLNDNQFTGEIPESICNLILGDNSTQLAYNQFCPPYPSCILDYVNDQDTANCEEVSVINGVILTKYTLYNAYPNPFNPITTLKYELPEDSFVDVTIYDMLGNVVSNLISTNQSSGYKSVQWNATNNQGEPVSAGVYLYKIQAGDFVDTKKMILLK